MKNESNYIIKGNDLQFVEINLAPGERAVAEVGSMMYMKQGIQFSTSISDGSSKHKGVLGSLKGIGKRMISGENLFLTHFTNKSKTHKQIAFAGPFQGNITALELNPSNKNIESDKGAYSGSQIMCQKGAFLCATDDVAVELGFSRRLSAGLFGGEGFVLQKISGSGTAFIHAGGAVEKKFLNKNESIFIDTGSLLAFEFGMDFDIEVVRGVTNMIFGGEDLFLTKITGAGYVWVQSMPHVRLMQHTTEEIIKILKKDSK